MSNVELVIRTVGATAAFVLALAMLAARGAPWTGRICGALLCLGVVSYLPCSANWNMCWHPATMPASSLASAIPFFFWGWTRSITDDDFQFTWLPITAGVVLICMPLCMMVLPEPTGRYLGWSVLVHSAVGIAFVVAALAGVVRTWRQDLIETRRRLRWIVLVAAGAYSIIVMSVEVYYRNEMASAGLQLLNAISLTILLLAICGVLLTVSETARTAFGWRAEQVAMPLPVQPAAVAVRDPDQELIDKLQTLMTGKALYRDANLSVPMLANALGVQEKRLREIINGRLGHKNLPSYVNAYRLEEVRQRLADSRNDHLPILTLALDAGFGSIVVFNRAFKERYSMTPTEYRATRVGEAGGRL
jgi:AraC-like DNA-binding protein